MTDIRDIDGGRGDTISGRTLLHVSASPRGPHSESLAIAEVFLDAYRAAHPGDTIRTWDLWDGTLPAFGPEAVAAKMAVFAGADPEGAAAVAWGAVRDAFDRLAAADEFLFSVPMWNHGVPYLLKQLIDVVSQPGMVFGFDPEQGYTGLLTGKRATVIYTSAVYGEGRPPSFGSDFQAPYFDSWLEWAGITDHRSILFRPNLATPDPEPARAAALVRARALAAGEVHRPVARAS